MISKSGEFLTVFGQPLFRYGCVDSTQNIAREKAQAGFPAGTVVTAQSMTAGRGRRGRVWHVPPGANVCLTAVCPPLDDPSAAWQSAFLAGLAAIEAVHEVIPQANAILRFPNDLMADGKKVGGVLVETTTVSGEIIPLVGIGINCRAASLPPEIAQKATSLENAAGHEVSVSDVETALLNALSHRWHEWQIEGFAATLAAWKNRADLGEGRVFVLDGLPLVCHVADITPDGTVTLHLPDGQTHNLNAAQVILGDD